ncbi:hypothetical protein WME99_04315 [Sorangium sp. So ce136]|uniref:hypothetical protein n=1 Tax=Sorangium sp. So ce136 TaxID=3133284 RepID=UPI003F07A6AC
MSEEAAPDESMEEEESADEERPAFPARDLRSWLAGATLPARLQIALGLVAPMLITIVAALHVSSFTIDDAYISFRYAENLARGNGLVCNVGERVEGYTSFLWTVLLAAAVKVGATPTAASKVLGAACACGALVPTYLLSQRLRRFSNVPCRARDPRGGAGAGSAQHPRPREGVLGWATPPRAHLTARSPRASRRLLAPHRRFC